MDFSQTSVGHGKYQGKLSQTYHRFLKYLIFSPKLMLSLALKALLTNFYVAAITYCNTGFLCDI